MKVCETEMNLLRSLQLSAKHDQIVSAADATSAMLCPTTLKYLSLKKIQHKFYTIKRAFRGGDASEAEAHAAIVKQICECTRKQLARAAAAALAVPADVTTLA